MNSTHTVSIAVAVYNGSKYIDDCVKCISQQTYAEYEVLFVVDSKTTDDSLDKIESYLPSFYDARIIMQNDSDGLSGARNIGIKEAKGDILWFLDVDDLPYPTFLSEMIKVMDEHDSDVVCCNILMSKDRTIADIPDREYNVREMTNAEAVENFTSLPIYSWSRIQRRSIFDTGEAVFIRYPSGEDIEQTIRTFSVANKVCYYNKPLYLYYKTDSSATKKHRNTESESINDIARSSLAFVKEKCPEAYPQFRRKMLERVMRQMAFVDYGSFSRSYRDSVAHDILKEIDDKSMEMKVFSFSKTLYYCILFPFTHYLWDNKTGLWDSD